MKYSTEDIFDLSKLQKGDLLAVQTIEEKYRGFSSQKVYEVKSIIEEKSKDSFIVVYALDLKTLEQNNYRLFASNCPIYQEEINKNLKIYKVVSLCD